MKPAARPGGRRRPGTGLAALAGALFAVLALARPAAADAGPDRDWPNLAAYRQANGALGQQARDERRVVFMGDSITEFWARTAPALFANESYVNRGISGQTTPQMLLRFRQDVIDLRPAAVVILAGTNDLAGNTGPATLEMIEGNLASMAELARAHGIKVVMASLLPASGYSWSPAVRPAADIVALNGWIREFARRNGFAFVDYHSPMADGRGGLRPEYSDDGVHPNRAGYAIMTPLVEAAVARALGGP